MATDMPEGISGPVGFFDQAGFCFDLRGNPRGAEGPAKFFYEAELKDGTTSTDLARDIEPTPVFSGRVRRQQVSLRVLFFRLRFF